MSENRDDLLEAKYDLLAGMLAALLVLFIGGVGVVLGILAAVLL